MKIECTCGKFVESVHPVLVDKLGFSECTVAFACITRGIDATYSNSVLAYSNSVLVSLNSLRIVCANFCAMCVHMRRILVVCGNDSRMWESCWQCYLGCVVSIRWKVLTVELNESSNMIELS